MPLVKKRLFLTAGSTSEQVLASTTYEYVDPNTVIRVAAAVDTAGTSATADRYPGAAGSGLPPRERRPSPSHRRAWGIQIQCAEF